MERLFREAQGNDVAVSVILFDVDHFKSINDSLGHEQGDQVLKSLCERVRLVTRKSDLLCRMGGEEFTLVCPSSTLDDTVVLAEKLREAIGATPLSGLGKVTCSFGVAVWVSSESLDQLFKQVDQAMYRAKAKDCNRVMRV
ncbi:GGDEF domain-containing protein [Pseudomonas gingeri]|uniref:diguanylate cyclase n=1 Tax=Pseudomonas gingeri TaxID=117681 RepID=A0A7Y7XGW9_9PSED|nr:GGDEF domain-containing protein [Pseudomonas gingeri]